MTQRYTAEAQRFTEKKEKKKYSKTPRRLSLDSPYKALKASVYLRVISVYLCVPSSPRSRE
jgi:ATP/ADP translocase